MSPPAMSDSKNLLLKNKFRTLKELKEAAPAEAATIDQLRSEALKSSLASWLQAIEPEAYALAQSIDARSLSPQQFVETLRDKIDRAKLPAASAEASQRAISEMVG